MRPAGLRTGILLSGLVPALICASPARAQVQIGLTAGVGMPTHDPLVQQFGSVNGLPVSYPVLEKWRVGSFVWTGRVTRWTRGRLGFETTGGVSVGRMNSRDSTNRVREIPSVTMMASVRMPVRLNRATAPLIFHASPGIGLLQYTGSAWSGFGGRAHPAAVVSFGGRGRMGRRSRIWFKFEFEDWMSQAVFTNGGVKLDPQFHHTTVFNLGVIHQFGSRR